MAIRLKAAGGLCCSCEERVTPCNCQVILPTECRHIAGLIAPTVSASCSTRTATAELCGFSEYTAASTPPKKYRRQTSVRHALLPNYATGSCSGGPNVELSTEYLNGGSVPNRATIRVSSAPGVGGIQLTFTSEFEAGDAPQYALFGLSIVGLGGVYGNTVGPGNPSYSYLYPGSPTASLVFRLIIESGFDPEEGHVERDVVVTGGYTSSPPTTQHGFTEYDAADCSLGEAGAPGARVDIASTAYDCLYGSVSVARLLRSRAASVSCCAALGGGFERAADSILSDALSIEDTESAAQARATWSAWSSWAACPGVVCCEAIWGLRAEFTWDMTEARWRAIVGALPVGATITVAITFWVRDLETEDEGPYATTTGSGLADGSGVAEVVVDVPMSLSGSAVWVQDYRLSLALAAGDVEEGDWATCVDAADTWAGQLSVRDEAGNESLAYVFTGHRTRWSAAPTGMRTARLYWERTDYGAGVWSPFGHSDVSLVNNDWSAWVLVPQSEGTQTRLVRSELMPL